MEWHYFCKLQSVRVEGGLQAEQKKNSKVYFTNMLFDDIFQIVYKLLYNGTKTSSKSVYTYAIRSPYRLISF